MQILAEELSNIHEYQLYKDIMKEVKQLEQDIAHYQDDLRSNIQQRQLKEYVEIGDDKIKEFFDDWSKKIADFEAESLSKIENLKLLHEDQMEMLNQRLDRAVEALKVKPVAKLKELQNQEKLVAINERIEEAMNYRKELKDLEIEEANRVEKVRNENAEKQRKKLLSEQVTSSPNTLRKRKCFNLKLRSRLPDSISKSRWIRNRTHLRRKSIFM